MDQLVLLKTFAAVAEAGQFALAAERLGLSRAMASKHVIDLEAQLGARLFNRTTRRVRLTEAGAVYLEKCRDILAALEEANREVSAQASEPVGRLRISAPMSFGQLRLAPVIAAYAEKYPRVSIDLSLTDRIVDIVEEGYDLAIRIGRLPDSSLISRKVGAIRLTYSAAPDYLAAHGCPERPQDLAGHECLQYSLADAWLFQMGGKSVGVQTRGAVHCNNGDALCRMAVAGLGIVALPDFIVAPFLARGNLQEILTAFSPPPLGIYVLHATHRHVPLKLRTMLDFLARTLSSGKAD